jgi:GTP-binding protein
MKKVKPIVAIVGRPNVGKSSLFNRFIGNRDAIVDDAVGITRDRHYGDCEWTGNIFTVIDTGGYLPESSHIIDKAIREQVDIAILEADVILMVVDVLSGITDTDIAVANKLRKTKKPVLLVANKADNAHSEQEIYSFFQLGLGDPFPVSAMVGRGSGDLLDVVVEKIKKIDFSDANAENSIKISVVGKENVGKSSFVNEIIGNNRNIVTEIAGTTRDSNDSFFKYNNRDYTLIDTAGLKKKAKVKENVLFYSQIRTMKSIDRSDVVLYFVDAENKITKQDQTVIGEIVERGKGIILVVNKWDLITDKTDKLYREFQDDLREKLPRLNYIPILMVSVHQNQRLRKIIELATEIYETKKNRVSTSKLNDYFLPIIKKKTPPSHHGREIKINFVSQVETDSPIIAFFVNEPKLLAEHYKRFLENKFREKFLFEGVPIKFIFRRKSEDRFKEE